VRRNWAHYRGETSDRPALHESSTLTGITVQTTVTGPAGGAGGSARSALSVAQAGEAETTLEIAVANPKLWSVESPTLYRAVTRVMKDGKAIDEVVTPFGIRSLAWSAEKGFLLNGTVGRRSFRSRRGAESRIAESCRAQRGAHGA
jgi:beta-galactosidase/beta-glucuronidase